jgi:hypothetical protein
MDQFERKPQNSVFGLCPLLPVILPIVPITAHYRLLLLPIMVHSSERTCPPLPPEDGRFDPTSPTSIGLSCLTRSRCAQLRKANHFLAHLALLVGPEALSRPATAQNSLGRGRPPPLRPPQRRCAAPGWATPSRKAPPSAEDRG